jgi:hypothetical protein
MQQRNKVNLRRKSILKIEKRKITLRLKQFMIIVDHDRINNDPMIKAQEREHCRNPIGDNLIE